VNRVLRATVALVIAVAATSCVAGSPFETVPPPTSPPLTVPPTITSPVSTSSTSTMPTNGSSTTTTAPFATTVPTPISIALPNVFGQKSAGAIEEIQALGLAVVSYAVCSGSVGEDEVRQVVTVEDGQEIELVGKAGVTEAGRHVSPFSILEVKIGTGVPCG
jgi:hypothetical protein